MSSRAAVPSAAPAAAYDATITDFLVRRAQAGARGRARVRTLPEGCVADAQLSAEIGALLTASGDSPSPHPATIAAVKSLLIPYLDGVLSLALDDAAQHPTPGAHTFGAANVLRALDGGAAGGVQRGDPPRSYAARHAAEVVAGAAALREALATPVSARPAEVACADGGLFSLPMPGAPVSHTVRIGLQEKDELAGRIARGEGIARMVHTVSAGPAAQVAPSQGQVQAQAQAQAAHVQAMAHAQAAVHAQATAHVQAVVQAQALKAAEARAPSQGGGAQVG